MTRHYPYLIIGGGMTADAAVRGIRQIDPDRPVGLICQEPDPPYNRPPLSKGLWKTGPRPMPLSRIWRGTANLGVDLFLGRSATQIDPASQKVLDDLGGEYSYDRLLLATGGEPVRLGANHDRIVYFRTLADYHRLRRLIEQYRRFAVIGGGFIGSELAAVLTGQGKEVVMVFPEPGICARVLPTDFAMYLNAHFRDRGVQVLNNELVNSIAPSETGIILHTSLGKTLQVDAVVAGLGIRPNVSLAISAGLATGNGILVDRFLQTSHPNIFAAGDVANFHNPILDMRMRPEHEENANLSGQTAGMNMAGQPTPYNHLPAVYSTIFDISYDAVGELDPTLQTLSDWQEPYQKGATIYFREGKVRGVLLVNLPRGLENARTLISGPSLFNPGELISRLSG